MGDAECPTAQAEAGNPFNVRVAECRVACKLLERALGVRCAQEPPTMQQVLQQSGMTLEELKLRLEACLPAEGLLPEQAAELIDAAHDPSILKVPLPCARARAHARARARTRAPFHP